MAVRGIFENGDLVYTDEISNIESEYVDSTISELDELYFDKYRMIFYFKYYIIQKYGNDKWYELLDYKQFRKMYYYSVNTYGDGIFGCLVDISVEVLKQPVGEVLMDYSSYVRTVQDLNVQSFAKFD